MKLTPPHTKDSAIKAAESLLSTDAFCVWEGAVRSGKTVIALVAFAAYVIRSPETEFLISGRTIRTIEKNCILNDYGLLNLIPGSRYGFYGEDRVISFSVRTDSGIVTKHISVAGAADIRAYMSIRGNTYGGWFADEVNMHDREFVAEALRRTAVSRDRRHFWTLNPDNPRHWVYTEYLDYYSAMSDEEKKELGGFRLWKFTPMDNPAMTPTMLSSLKVQYPEGSYLYRRYILGERCVAEGLIYPHVGEAYFRDFDPKDVKVSYCAIDFGADHPTVMLFGGTFKGNRFDWRLVAEYFDEKSDKTTYDHYCGFLDVCKRLGVDPNRITIAIDPAAKVLRVEFIKHGLTVIKAKNDVSPGIEFTRSMIYDRRLTFHKSMRHTLEEFGSYSWDPKASERGEEKPIKIHDDCMDALRYFTYTHMRPEIGFERSKER